MSRITMCSRLASVLTIALCLCGCGKSATPAATVADAQSGKQSAEALIADWTFSPGKDAKVQSYGSETAKSGENLVIMSARLRDPGKAQEWMAKASAFYSKKCGSDKDPIKVQADTGKHALGINGEDAQQGRYLITEPALMSTPIPEIPATPESLVFAHEDTHASITAVIWQRNEDVVMIAVTVAVH